MFEEPGRAPVVSDKTERNVKRVTTVSNEVSIVVTLKWDYMILVKIPVEPLRVELAAENF